MIRERGDLELLSARDDFDLERETESRPWLGLFAGLAAGLVATLAMDGFQSLTKRTTAPLRRDETAGDEQEEPSTVKLGRRLSKRVLHRDLDDSSAQVVSDALHYGYGTLMGGVYGLMAEFFPKTAIAAGAPYGALLFTLGDEVAVPALGLAKKPTAYPIGVHARAFGAHLVYGTALDLLRRGIRSCMLEVEAKRDRRGGYDRARAVVFIDRTEIETKML